MLAATPPLHCRRRNAWLHHPHHTFFPSPHPCMHMLLHALPPARCAAPTCSFHPAPALWLPTHSLWSTSRSQQTRSGSSWLRGKGQRKGEGVRVEERVRGEQGYAAGSLPQPAPFLSLPLPPLTASSHATLCLTHAQRYNLRVVECRLAAALIARRLGHSAAAAAAITTLKDIEPLLESKYGPGLAGQQAGVAELLREGAYMQPEVRRVCGFGV